MFQSTSDTILAEILRTLRSSLNACAEPPHQEAITAQVITNFLNAYSPDVLLTGLGGHGIAAVFNGMSDGPSILFRCELDGLPVENLSAEHGARQNASHRCGHDGHMTMVAGLAPILSQMRPVSGRAILLFQPAEETGDGALGILTSPHFPAISPDVAIACHNLPGFRRNVIIVRSGVFAGASGGLRIQFLGTASHAAEPELSKSPRVVLSRMLMDLPALSNLNADPYRMVTITHAQMGIESFGTAPGDATLCATLRSSSSEGLETLCQDVETRVREAAIQDGIDIEIRRIDWFPETCNDANLVDELKVCCGRSGVHMQELQRPFRWSEDFGHFSRVCRTLYFGLGIGEDAAGLHQSDYVFPDDVLPVGLEVYHQLLRMFTDRYHPPSDSNEKKQDGQCSRRGTSSAPS